MLIKNCPENMKEIGSIFPLYSEDIALKGIQPTNEQRSDIPSTIRYAESYVCCSKKYEKAIRLF